jgi:hypothetical protein
VLDKDGVRGFYSFSTPKDAFSMNTPKTYRFSMSAADGPSTQNQRNQRWLAQRDFRGKRGRLHGVGLKTDRETLSLLLGSHVMEGASAWSEFHLVDPFDATPPISRGPFRSSSAGRRCVTKQKLKFCMHVHGKH